MKQRLPGQRIMYAGAVMIVALFVATFVWMATRPHESAGVWWPLAISVSVTWLFVGVGLFSFGMGRRDEAVARENGVRWAEARGIRLPRTADGAVDWPTIERTTAELLAKK